MTHAPKQGHNHNLDCVALNYLCPINQLKVVSHNRTKCRENGTREQNYFLSHTYAGQSIPFGSRMGTGTPTGARGLSLTFFNVDGWRSRISVSTHRGGPSSTFLNIDGGRFWISSSSTPLGGPPSTFFSVDGGRSQISVSTHQGGLPSMFPSVDGGRSRISSSGTSQGTHHRCFLALMVTASGSLAPTPPRRPTIDIFYVDGGCFWISVR
jgi:hypothetical protein